MAVAKRVAVASEVKNLIDEIARPLSPAADRFERLTLDHLQRAAGLAQWRKKLLRDWSQVPGSTKSGTIDLVGRTAASGTQDAFQKIFMGTTTVTSSIAAKSTNGLVQQAVQTDPNAVGYVSLDFINGTNVAGYNGVACNLRNAKSGEYGGVRNFWMVTRGRATGAAKTFISWIQNNPKAQAIVAKDWVPLK